MSNFQLIVYTFAIIATVFECVKSLRHNIVSFNNLNINSLAECELRLRNNLLDNLKKAFFILILPTLFIIFLYLSINNSYNDYYISSHNDFLNTIKGVCFIESNIYYRIYFICFTIYLIYNSILLGITVKRTVSKSKNFSYCSAWYKLIKNVLFYYIIPGILFKESSDLINETLIFFKVNMFFFCIYS